MSVPVATQRLHYPLANRCRVFPTIANYKDFLTNQIAALPLAPRHREHCCEAPHSQLTAQILTLKPAVVAVASVCVRLESVPPGSMAFFG